MTRLKTHDIRHIFAGLGAYDQALLAKTGRSLLGIACHACDVDEIRVKQIIRLCSIDVVPVTAGQGIITDFCGTVAAILEFLGFKARVSGKTDVSGIAGSFEGSADAVMMADDHMFAGLNLTTRKVVDNSEATGRVFAAALDLMVKGVNPKQILVLGCGPVGESAARTLLSAGADVALYDIDTDAARSLKNRLLPGYGADRVTIEQDMEKALLNHLYIMEATPSADTIPDNLIGPHMVVAAPGVPLGISEKGCRILADRLIHDKLELGVAAMAVSLIT